MWHIFGFDSFKGYSAYVKVVPRGIKSSLEGTLTIVIQDAVVEKSFSNQTRVMIMEKIKASTIYVILVYQNTSPYVHTPVRAHTPQCGFSHSTAAIKST